jgi:CubicO group peptidase (beta-lactamase class C family)
MFVTRRIGRWCGIVALAAVASLVASACSGSGSPPPATATPSATSSAPTATAEAGDPRTELEDAVDLYLSAGDRHERLIRAVLVSVDGEVVVERYSATSSADATANVFSVTKSVMSTLIGIAIDEGSIAGFDETLGHLLPTHAAGMSPEVASITLEQLLTMTSGIAGQEIGSVLDPFLSSDDWVGFILAAPLTGEPGTAFEYSNANSHLLSAILANATGRPVIDYAREKLFQPLNIASEPATQPLLRHESPEAFAAFTAEFDATPGFAWAVDPQGLNTGFSELKITARDMLTLGELYLREGRHGDHQIVSAGWVAAATQPQVGERVSFGSGYGYQWWIGEVEGHESFAAVGWAGQLVQVVPDLGLVMVVSCLDDPARFDSLDIASDLTPTLVRTLT